MGQILLIWGFPFYLMVLEMIFRGVSGLDVSSFIGPAIATAGLSFLLPLTKPKDYSEVLSDELRTAVIENGATVVNLKDQSLIPFIWISILCGFLVWFWASSISANKPTEIWLFIPLHVAIGSTNYILAALFTIIKERI